MEINCVVAIPTLKWYNIEKKYSTQQRIPKSACTYWLCKCNNVEKVQFEKLTLIWGQLKWRIQRQFDFRT